MTMKLCRIGNKEDSKSGQANERSFRASNIMPANSMARWSRGSIDLDDTGAFNDGRFFLPFGKVLGAFAVDINAREFLTVVVVNGHLPMAVLSPAVLMETDGIPSFLLAHDIFRPPWLRAIWQVPAARASSNLKVDVHYIIGRFLNAPKDREHVGILLDKQENARQQSAVVALFRRIKPIMSHIRARKLREPPQEARSAGAILRSLRLAFLILKTAGPSLDWA